MKESEKFNELLDAGYDLVYATAYLEGWNDAIDKAEQETYKSFDPFEINHSILNLKFDKDEK